MKFKKFVAVSALVLSVIGLTSCSQTESAESVEESSTISTELVQKEKLDTLELKSSSFVSDDKGNIVIAGKTVKNAVITTTYSDTKVRSDSNGVFKLIIPLKSLAEPIKTNLIVISDLGKLTKTVELVPSKEFIAAKQAEEEKIAA